MGDASRLGTIPSVDRILALPGVASLLVDHNRSYVVEAIRSVCAEVREKIRNGQEISKIEDEIIGCVQSRIARGGRSGPVPVVNATGIVLHTNLGRAPLPDEAIAAVTRAARDASALELDLSSGRRGDRDRTVEEDLIALTGAEAATVVNNNAAAVLLALNTLAEGRAVVVSRGELIEIGGSFRIPDVMAKSGARLLEVGTTNRTHATDYEAAIDERTGALLKVHTSNYRIVGFTAEVSLEELVQIGRRHSVPVIEDLGSGALVDLGRYGLPREPVVSERIAAGADVVTFSGDKLLGGPQAGILVGRGDTIARIKQNPLCRALRPGKLTLAALAAVLRLYRRSPDLAHDLPTLRALTRSLDEMRALGAHAAKVLAANLGEGYAIEVVDSTAEVGSGAQPTEALPSVAVAVTSERASPDEIAVRFRSAARPILGRIHERRFLLDLRWIFEPNEIVPDP